MTASADVRFRDLDVRHVSPERIALGSPQVEALIDAVLSDRLTVGEDPG